MNTSINYQYVMECVCGKTFYGYSNLKTHQPICETLKEKGTQCITCLRTYKTLESLRGHLRYDTRKPQNLHFREKF